MHVNLIAVAVASVAGMIVGALWYGPLFGRAWRAAAGLGPKHQPPSPALAYGGAFVSTIVTVLVLAALSSLVGAGLNLDPMPAALLTAGALWVGVAFARPLINLLFEAGRARLFLINTGHDLAVLLVAAVIIGLFGN